MPWDVVLFYFAVKEGFEETVLCSAAKRSPGIRFEYRGFFVRYGMFRVEWFQSLDSLRMHRKCVSNSLPLELEHK